MSERMFPVIRGYREGPAPREIPWVLAERAYVEYSARYGARQSLERMAERGGFYPSELDEYIPGWREEINVTGAAPGR